MGIFPESDADQPFGWCGCFGRAFHAAGAYRNSDYVFLIPGYAIALFLTLFVPKIFTAIAFDSGGVASGPMTATFLLPLAQGACTAVGGDVVKDAFGVVAMVAMTPLITLQVLGLIYKIKSNKKEEMAEQPFLQAEDVFAGYADDAIIEL